jgi:hypothetical protein
VKGSGSAGPSANELVAFPGAYSDEDPGIVTPTIFDMKKASDYQFPGPDVSKLASTGGGGGGSSDGDEDNTSSSSASSPKPTSTKTATSSSESATGTPSSAVHAHTGSCTLKKRSAAAMKKRGSYHPKRYSRIMRDLASSLHL